MIIASSLTTRTLPFITALASALFAGIPANAAEIALLAGYQADSNLQITSTDQWPPDRTALGSPGDAVGLDEGSSWAVAINTIFKNRPAQRIGLYFSQHSTAFEPTAGLADPSLDISFLHFTGTSFYPQDDRLSFFVLAGIGAAFYRPDDATLDDVTRFSAQVGAGANYLLTENLFLQFDARWLPTFFSNDTTIFCSGGCTVTVNSKTFNQFQMNAGLLLRF